MSKKELEQISKLEALGIETDVFDTEEEYDPERERDISRATIFILNGEPVPADLEKCLLDYNLPIFNEGFDSRHLLISKTAKHCKYMLRGFILGLSD